MARGGGVEHIGFEHGVEAETAETHAVVREHVEVVFQVLADLARLVGLEQRLEFLSTASRISCAGASG